MSQLEIVTPLHHIWEVISSWIDTERLRAVMLFDPVNPLLFNTGLFLLLAVAFFFLYRLLSRWSGARMVCIILFSLYFYYKSSAECCFILLGVCLSDYLLGIILGNVRNRILRRCIVAVNVIVNIGMLVYFKYLNLIFSTFASIGGTDFDALDIILPAGISFFTFRSISYIVDIYRGTLRPATNLLDYIFFLTFFPPLLAGPVVRAADMLPQIKRRPVATRAMVGAGLFLIICGLIKKSLSPIISAAILSTVCLTIQPCIPVWRICLLYMGSHYSCIAISRVIRIWLSDWPCCWDSHLRTISMLRLSRRVPRNGGAGGIYLCRHGCATICIFLWEVAVAP